MDDEVVELGTSALDDKSLEAKARSAFLRAVREAGLVAPKTVRIRRRGRSHLCLVGWVTRTVIQPHQRSDIAGAMQMGRSMRAPRIILNLHVALFEIFSNALGDNRGFATGIP